jgi:hypothetical protein
MKLTRLALAAAAMASLSACATITRGTSTTWDVQTLPSGAAVKTTHGYTCDATPCSLKMPRKSAFVATITKPGYKTVEATVGNRVSTGGGAAMAGNLLLGGIIGGGVDAGSGAMLDLRPDPLVVRLEPGEGTITMTQEQAEGHSASQQAGMPQRSSAKPGERSTR